MDLKKFYTRTDVEFPEFRSTGFSVIEICQFLYGRKFDELTLAFLHGFNPTCIRVSADGVTMDACVGRVTVWVDKYNVVTSIEQEVEVGLPKGVDHGHHLSKLVGKC